MATKEERIQSFIEALEINLRESKADPLPAFSEYVKYAEGYDDCLSSVIYRLRNILDEK